MLPPLCLLSHLCCKFLLFFDLFHTNLLQVVPDQGKGEPSVHQGQPIVDEEGETRVELPGKVDVLCTESKKAKAPTDLNLSTTNATQHVANTCVI